MIMLLKENSGLHCEVNDGVNTSLNFLAKVVTPLVTKP
jgi:hypothetical protein